jgi:hypothetical protein
MPYTDRAELERSGRFANIVVRRYERELTYSTSEYRELLLSYSGHRALAPDSREALLACIGELMESTFDGRIAKRYLTEMTVAQTRRVTA